MELEIRDLLDRFPYELRRDFNEADLRKFVILSIYKFLINKNIIKDEKAEEVFEKERYSIDKDESIVFEKYLNLFVENGKVNSNALLELLNSSFKNIDRRMNDGSPEELSILVFELFGKIQSNSTILDSCLGYGAFLNTLLRNNIYENYNIEGLYGTDIVDSNISIFEIYTKCLNALTNKNYNVQVYQSNSMKDDFNKEFTYSYIFPPMGLKFSMRENVLNSKLFDDVKFSGKNNAEWIFIDNALKHTSKKAVAVVPLGALYKTVDKEYRDHLLENGYIEGIIELPNNIMSFGQIKTALIIFSKGNKEVKILDASKLVDNDGLNKNNSVLDVDAIKHCYFASDCAVKSTKDLLKEENLTPSILLREDLNIKDATKLKDVAQIFTGSQYTSKNFEPYFTDENTGYRILTSSDIENGFVDWKKLKKIVCNDTKIEKFAIHKNDIVVTSKSSKVKTVVVEIEPKEKIIVTGGMIIVRPDVTKLNPTYFKMFLDSDLGKKILSTIQKGSIIITINSRDLSEILIPLIDLESQNRKAIQYNNTLSEIYSYKEQIVYLENKLKNIFSEDED